MYPLHTFLFVEYRFKQIKEVKTMTPTGNRLIDTVIYIAGSAIAFNVILPIFAAVIKAAQIIGLM